MFLGERDAIFRAPRDGPVSTVAFSGGPGPLGGVFAVLGSPVVDGEGTVYFGAEFQGGAQYNSALLRSVGASVEPYVTPDRRLLGGGGIRELFPTGVDTLARPAAGATPGVFFTASLQGARASVGLFHARGRRRMQAVAAVGQRASQSRLAALGTPAVGSGQAAAFLAEVGRGSTLPTAVVAGEPRRLAVVATAGKPTGTRMNGRFDVLGPPAIAQAGAVFRATLDAPGSEGVFLGRGARLGVVAATGDPTMTGGRLRTFGDPVAFGDDIWFLARIAGSQWPVGLYRVRLSKVPRADDAPVVEPVFLPGDAMPVPVGGVVVRLDALRGGPSGVVTVVAPVSGGTSTGAIVAFAPALP